MAVLASPGTELGYIKTVLGQEHFMDLDNSTLALPTEEKLKISRQDLEKARRLQHQVQLTMARKTNKKSLTNGISHRSTSIPDHVQYHARDVTLSPSKYYGTVKDYSSSVFENGGGGHTLHSNRRQENGWGRSYSTYTQWGNEQDTSQGRTLVRKDISPERVAGSAAYEQRKRTLRHSELRQYSVAPIRYSHSEFGTAARARQSTVKKSNQSDQDSVFQSVPTSPVRPIYQQRNSRSLNNLLEKENYQTGAAAGQVITRIQPQMSNRAGYQQTIQRTTVSGREYFQSPHTAGGIDLGGKTGTLTAGMAAATGSANMQIQHDGGRLESHVGNTATMTSEVDMTLERAVSLLQNESTSPYLLTAAASFIQHECFQKMEARRRVYTLGGISRLIRLLNYGNVEVQRVTCAALRNLVFEDNDNKLEVCEQRGMPTLLNLLRDTQDVEIKRQITGLLWNLSSNDQLKGMLVRDALRPMTTSILIPCSGWSEGEYSKHEILSDADTFYNATGCLRNMSSAGPEGRKAMRECDGLIDSLVYYVRRTVADHMPDDKATENCVCILHNLSFQLESEVPSRYSQNFHLQSRDAPQNDRNVGCFGTRSRKIKEEWREAPMAEEASNPRGVEWLWHSIVVRMYLSLIAKSSRNYTQEASLGSLQNLTAGSGPMPFSVAQMVVQKESGLQHIRNMLFSSNPGVKRTAVSLLRNMSRNSSLHNEIARELMSDLVRTLPDSAPDSNIANETSASVCYILNNLISDGSDNARSLLQNGGVQKLVNISMSDSTLSTKSGKAASLVLYNLWSHQDLHTAYKKALYKKTDFVNPKTSKAYHSL
ncbi:plakophilin-2 [Pseudophryne corroboree]|uniref:plakophilin-2 n=1 Tax=Pseudophryne corroboree TaxID=495146 RepID=UPI003081443D